MCIDLALCPDLSSDSGQKVETLAYSTNNAVLDCIRCVLLYAIIYLPV